MEAYRNFSIASFMFAYYAAKVTDEELRQGLERYLSVIPLRKVYVENHRANTDVPVERLRQIKAILEEYGMAASGGITATALVGDVQKASSTRFAILTRRTGRSACALSGKWRRCSTKSYWTTTSSRRADVKCASRRRASGAGRTSGRRR